MAKIVWKRAEGHNAGEDAFLGSIKIGGAYWSSVNGRFKPWFFQFKLPTTERIPWDFFEKQEEAKQAFEEMFEDWQIKAGIKVKSIG